MQVGIKNREQNFDRKFLAIKKINTKKAESK